MCIPWSHDTMYLELCWQGWWLIGPSSEIVFCGKIRNLTKNSVHEIESYDIDNVWKTMYDYHIR